MDYWQSWKQCRQECPSVWRNAPLWPHHSRDTFLNKPITHIHIISRASRLGRVTSRFLPSANSSSPCQDTSCGDLVKLQGHSAADALASAPPFPPVPPGTIFDPQLPDTSVLAAQGLVLVLTAAAAGYWWLVVVPSERAALGRSKRLGPLNSYLQELERPEAAQARWLERWFYTDWLRMREDRRRHRQQQQQQLEQLHDSHTTGGTAGKKGNTTSSNRSTVADSSYGGSSYESDESITNLLRPSASTPTPRFLSLDNPIVATGVLLLLAAAAGALQQQQP